MNARSLLWLSFLILESICVYHYYQNYSKLISTSNQTYSRTNVDISLGKPNLIVPISNKDIRNIYSNKRIFTSEQTFTHSYSKSPPRAELDWEHILVSESGYPKFTRLLDYTTSATEAEVEKHDRLLVQGMTYMKSFLPKDAKKRRMDRDNQTFSEARVCLNIYLCNRRIPYINSLLMSLTSFSNEESESDFRKTAQVHLLNTEKRPGRTYFPYLKDKLSNLSFVHQVHNVTYPDEIYANITDRDLDFRESFISDEISGLKICIESGLPYCLMIEEDAVVPIDFMTLLLQQVIQPLEKQGFLNPEDGTGSISLISLYSYYNLVFFGPHRLHFPRYSKNKYVEDRAKLNIERWGMNMLPYEPIFKVADKEYKYGTVAMFYTRQSALKLIEFMQKVGVDPIHNADEFMNSEEYFPKIFGAKRKHVMPSLVNHIGFYSERMAHVKSRGMFSQLNTDARFMFDAGRI